MFFQLAEITRMWSLGPFAVGNDDMVRTPTEHLVEHGSGPFALYEAEAPLKGSHSVWFGDAPHPRNGPSPTAPTRRIAQECAIKVFDQVRKQNRSGSTMKKDRRVHQQTSAKRDLVNLAFPVRRRLIVERCVKM